MKFKNFLTFGLIFSSPSLYAQALEEAVTKDVELKQEEQKEDVKFGWGFSQELSLGANFLSNSNVAGQTDGESRIYSLKYNLKAEEIQEHSEWISIFNINEAIARTPTIDRYVKSTDEVKLSSIYKNFLTNYPKLGGFVKFEASAPALTGYSEHSEDKLFQIVDLDGNITEKTTDQLKITDGGRPLTLKQSVGLLAKISNHKAATFEVRTGLGARQILAEDQLEVADNKDTEVIEIITREDISILGTEVLAELKGELLSGKLTYNIYTEALMPIQYSPENDEAPANDKLVSTETGVKLNYALTEWASIAYDFKSKREPLVKPEAEVTHSLLLTAALKNSF